MIRIRVLTPHGIIIDQQADQCSFPTPDGMRTFRARQMASLVIVDTGNIRIFTKDSYIDLMTSQGIMNYKNNDMTFMVHTAKLTVETTRLKS